MRPLYTLEQLEPQILLITWDGVINTDYFREATEKRVEFAKNNISGNYVLIFDLSKAVIAMMDMRLTTWSANIDPHMICTIVIGRHGILSVIANMLVRLSKLKVEFADNGEKALERAQAVIAQDAGSAQTR